MAEEAKNNVEKKDSKDEKKIVKKEQVEEKVKKDSLQNEIPKEIPKKDVKKEEQVKKEPNVEEKPVEKKPEKKEEEKEDVVEIVRVLSTDLDGKMKIKNSLRKIKGIYFVTGKVFCDKAKVNPEKLTGNLEEAEIKRIEEVLKNPEKFNIPDYILNLRKNPYTGKDTHMTGAELQIEVRKIIGDKKKLGSYSGMRHRLGLPVRGQRTRSSFRKSRSVGVSKKRPQPDKK